MLHRAAFRTATATVLSALLLVQGAASAPSAYADEPIGPHMDPQVAVTRALGAPTAPEEMVTTSGMTGWVQNFENGRMFNSAFGTTAVSGATLTEFDSVGGLDSIGWPMDGSVRAEGGGYTGWVQVFSTNGRSEFARIYERPGAPQAVVVKGGILSHYKDKGGLALGWPKAREQAVSAAGSSGWTQEFATASDNRSAMVTYRYGVGGLLVKGGIFDWYLTSGGLAAVGWPTAQEAWNTRCYVWQQNFTVRKTLNYQDRWCPADYYAAPMVKQPGAGSGYTLYSAYNGSAVHFVQKRLGIAFGNMSTVMGPTTVSKVKSFQASRGIPANGVVDVRTWNALATGMPFSTSTWSKTSDVGVSGANPQQRRTAIVNYAKAQLGKPYMWGGTGNVGNPVGFDCSGLALQAVRAGGVNLRWVSNWFNVYPDSDLSNRMWLDNEMQTVPMHTLLPGDLVFYGDATRVKHVAIYIGNEQAINAVGTRVQVKSVWDQSGWKVRYGAKRPVSLTGGSAPISGTMTKMALGRPTNVGDPTMVVGGLPLHAVQTTVRGGTVTVPSGGAAVAPVATAQAVVAPTGTNAYFLDRNGYVVRVGSGRVVAPAHAVEVLVLAPSTLPGIAIDTKVERLS